MSDVALLHPQDGYRTIQQRMWSDEWWVVFSVNDAGRLFVSELEHEFYMDNNNDQFEIMMVMVPNTGTVTVAMFNKSECSVEQMRDFTGGITADQNIFLPCFDESEAPFVTQAAAYFSQETMPIDWPPESGDGA